MESGKSPPHSVIRKLYQTFFTNRQFLQFFLHRDGDQGRSRARFGIQTRLM